jgi:exosortase A
MRPEPTMSAQPEFMRFLRPKYGDLNALPVWQVAGCLVAVLAFYAATTRSMFDVWVTNDTYVHGLFVIPGVLYLTWLRRYRLSQLAVEPWLPGAVAVAACGFVWMLGEVSTSIGVTQFAMIAMVPAAILTLLGWQWLRKLAFPLAFLFFAVPAGEIFVPTLVDWTATYTVLLLRLSGVPVYRDGNMFEIPSGSWSVIEGCSGVRYLIASVVMGMLFAHLVYRSTKRRVLFVLASALVPIVANWLRAYGIVMLGHLSGNRIATGVDHLIYGWIFFAAITMGLFWLGMRWREDDVPDAHSVPVANSPAPPAVSTGRLVAAVALALAAGAVWPAVSRSIDNNADLRPVVAEPIALAGGWQTLPDPVSSWKPEVHGARAQESAFFTKSGARIGVHIAMFRDQDAGAEMVASSNIVASPDGADWRAIASRHLTLGDRWPGAAVVTSVQGDHQRLAVWHWYWMPGSTTTSRVRSKIDLVASRLRGHSDTSAWVLVYVEQQDADASAHAAAEAALKGFLADMGPSLEAALARTASR